MGHGQFERMASYYDEELEAIDEQLCALINKRKERSNNPGIPTEALISAWAKKYGFYEEFLNVLFGHLLEEDCFRPMIEPNEFVKNIPVLKPFEKDNLFYLVSFVRQYKNASVVQLTIDCNGFENTPGEFVHHHFYNLSIDDGKGTAYYCQNNGGGGSDGHTAMSYVISPPLPDDFANIRLVFKEERIPFKKDTSGFEFTIELDS